MSRADAGRPHADHRHGAGPAPGPPARASRCLQAAAADHRPARRGPDRHRVREQHGLQPPGRPRGLPRGLLAVGRPSDSWNTAALDQLEAAACVDAARVFVTGVSNGGGPTARLACDLSGRLAGVASVAGGYRTLRPCTPERPLPVLEIHGTADAGLPLRRHAARLQGQREAVAGAVAAHRRLPREGRPAEARARRDRGRLARTAAPRRASSTSASTAGPAPGPAARAPSRCLRRLPRHGGPGSSSAASRRGRRCRRAERAARPPAGPVAILTFVLCRDWAFARAVPA